METKTIRKLPVKLTDDELLVYGQEQAKLIHETIKLEIERATINAKIKPKKERVEELAIIIDSGHEERDVECQWQYRWETGEKFLLRLDTGELIMTEIIDEREKQMRFA